MRQRFQSGLYGCARVAFGLACALPAVPALYAQALPANPPTSLPDQQRTSPAAQQQPETPASKPIPQAESVQGQVPVPKSVPSMMPHEPGTELDRIVAIVDGQVVLDSDVNEERRFETIQPAATAGAETDSSPRDQEIERLVDRDLILQQAKLQTELGITSADVEKEIASIRRTLPVCKRYGCETDAGWERFLASHGFTAPEFRERWEQRMEVLAFVQERFGAGISVSAAQVRAFYQNTMLPQYAKAHVKPVPITAVEDRIREVLEQQQINGLLRDWLQSLRAQGSITILHPGEEAP